MGESISTRVCDQRTGEKRRVIVEIRTHRRSIHHFISLIFRI